MRRTCGSSATYPIQMKAALTSDAPRTDMKTKSCWFTSGA
jgi:hypothetical protein